MPREAVKKRKRQRISRRLEEEVLRLAARGYGAAMIAEKLGIKRSTVSYVLRRRAEKAAAPAL